MNMFQAFEHSENVSDHFVRENDLACAACH